MISQRIAGQISNSPPTPTSARPQTLVARYGGIRLALHEDALTIPLGWRSPRLVFVNSMSDLFQKDVPLSFIQQVFEVMTACPHHTFRCTSRMSRSRIGTS